MVVLFCGAITSAAAATATPRTAAGSPSVAGADIDCDGTTDTVVGVPSATVDGHAGAGAIDVFFGNGRVLRFDESLFGRTPAAGDRFGAADSFTDLNGDICDDVAIGAPGSDSGRGAVIIAVIDQNDHVDVAGSVTLTGSTSGEHFGAAIVSHSYANADNVGETNLWISAPDRRVDGVRQAGAVDQFHNSDADYDEDYTPKLVDTYTEDAPGVPGVAETGDGFGRTLDISANGPLLVGEPAEDVGSQVDAGTITALYVQSDYSGGSAYTYSQNTPGIPGVAEAGDHFGTSISSDDTPATGYARSETRLAVGAPGEALGRLKGAGTVDRFAVQAGSSSPVKPSAVTQDSDGVPGADEAYDRFGKRVLFDDGGLCIGVPGEDLGPVHDTGRVLCRGRHGGAAWVSLQQGSGTIPGSPYSGAAYGSELGRLPVARDAVSQYGGEDLLIAVPGADVSGVPASGQVRDIDHQLVRHDSAGAMAGERYGIPAFTPTHGPAGSSQ